jgi:hypothetical protein
MPAFGQHFQQRARQAELALDGLPAIGVAAERQRLTAIAGAGELTAQQLRRRRFGDESRFEIETG